MTRPSGISNGVTIGLRTSLFFLISFALMGYPVVLSIFLCLIGGLAGGLIHEWWRSKDTNSTPTPISDTAGTNSLLSRFQRKTPETRAEKWQKHSSRRKRKALKERLKERPRGLSRLFRRRQG